MSETRYNIPKQYKADIKFSRATLFQNIYNEKCRMVFEAHVESIILKYHMVDRYGITNVSELIKLNGLSIFEISLKQRIAPDLLTETFSELIQRPCVFVYLYRDEISIGAYMPIGKGTIAKKCTTDFYKYDSSKMIELLEFEHDVNKNVEQIHRRIYSVIKQQKYNMMIDESHRYFS